MLHLSYRHPGTSFHLHRLHSLLEKVYRKLFDQSNMQCDDVSQSDIFWGVAEPLCLTSRLSDSRFVIDLDPGGT